MDQSWKMSSIDGQVRLGQQQGSTSEDGWRQCQALGQLTRDCCGLHDQVERQWQGQLDCLSNQASSSEKQSLLQELCFFSGALLCCVVVF